MRSNRWARYAPLFASIVLRPVLLGPVLLVLGISWANLGDSYGVPDQFWSENAWIQFLAGLGAALLLFHVCLVAFLLDQGDRPPGATRGRIARRIRWMLPPTHPERESPWGDLYTFLSRSWFWLVGLIALACVFEISGSWPWQADHTPLPDTEQVAGHVYRGESPAGWQGPSLVVGLQKDWCLVVVILQRWPLLLGLLTSVLVIRGAVSVIRRFTPRSLPGFHADNFVGRNPRLVFHGVTFLVFGGIVWGVPLTQPVVPAVWHPWLCFLLGIWISLHGAIEYGVRLRQGQLAASAGVSAPPDDQAELHRLAGGAFSCTYLVFQILFLIYLVSPEGTVATWLAPPALVSFLLLALLVTVHGFLAHHFGRWYALALAGLLVLGVGVNFFAPFKLHFPHLDYPTKEEQPVHLLTGDFEGLARQVIHRCELWEQEPQEADKVQHSLARLARCYGNLHHRGQLQAKLLDAESLFARAPAPPDKLEATSPRKAREALARISAGFNVLRQVMEEMEKLQLRRWSKQASRDGKLPRLVVVCVSGGASRSAMWTNLVLNQLERDPQLPGFSRQVRIVTGASGGMVGASYWVATLSDSGHSSEQLDPETFLPRLGQDHLTSVGHHALFLDLPTLFLPGEFEADRGIALEKAWSVNFAGALDGSFRSLAAGEMAGWRPSLIFSPMLVEDGRQLLVSNLYLPYLTDSTGALLNNGGDDLTPRRGRPAGKPRPGFSGKKMAEPEVRMKKTPPQRYSLSALEFFQLFPRADAFRLSTAARMNASFPYISPAVDLPTEPRRRVVDAGYYDNYGVSLAARWLAQHREWLEENTSGVVLIQIRDSASEIRRLFPDQQERSWSWSRGVEWLTGPLVGAASAREAQMSFHNDATLESLTDLFNDDGREFFTTVVFEATVPIAMTWLVTRQDQAHLRAGWDSRTNQDAVQRLERWWKKGPTPRSK